MRWTLDDIHWDRFDPSRIDARLAEVVKAAALVEANSADYVAYLKNIFPDDAEFCAAAEIWGQEEAQHGAALGRWAEMADPGYNFERSLKWFREGYSLPLEATESVRGSRAGELIARQVVESGTSSFYTAIRDAADEPVLKEICQRIATDEFAHYQLFAKHFKRYDAAAKMGTLARLKVAVTRVQEAEDDELAYAFYAANVQGKPEAEPYDNRRHAEAYWQRAMALYQERHIDNATRMILRAAKIKPNGVIGNMAVKAFWGLVKFRRSRLAKAA